MSVRNHLPVMLGIFVISAGVAMAQTQASATSAAATQASAASSGAGQTMVDSGSKINAVLKSNVDARKAHVGDTVTAESTQALKSHGHVVVPKHSQLLGRITSVSAKGKDSSAVGVLFQQAVTPQGQHIPLNAGISSVLTAAGEASAMAQDGGDAGAMPMPMPQMAPAGGASAGGGLLGGVGSSVGSVAGGLTSTAGAAVQGGALPAGRLMSMPALRGSNGVPLQIRMLPGTPGMQANGSLLTSDQGDVRLDRGTRIQLQTMSQSSAEAQPGSASVSNSSSAQAQVHHN